MEERRWREGTQREGTHRRSNRETFREVCMCVLCVECVYVALNGNLGAVFCLWPIFGLQITLKLHYL